MRRRAARRRPGRGYHADRAEVWRALRVLAEALQRHQEWHIRFAMEDLAIRRREREEDSALRRKEREKDRAAREEDRSLRRKEREEDLAARRKEREEDLTLRREEREEDLTLRREARDEDLAARRQATDRDLALRRKANDEHLALLRKAGDEQAALFRQAGDEFLGTVQEGIREWNANRERGWRKIEKEIHRVIGDGDARWGRLMEALTEGDLPGILGDFGIEVTPPRRRMAATRGGYTREWDLVALGEEASVVVEVETTLRPEDVRQFRTRMEEFRLWMPDFDRNGMNIHGALAYLSADESVLRHAERRGFFLIRVVGSGASIRNPPDFVPAAF